VKIAAVLEYTERIKDTKQISDEVRNSAMSAFETAGNMTNLFEENGKKLKEI
jgi:hypothetical protein